MLKNPQAYVLNIPKCQVKKLGMNKYLKTIVIVE